MAHKFVTPPYREPRRSQEVLDIEVAELQTTEDQVPVAATVEEDRITVYWWHKETSTWEHWERFHEVPTPKKPKMADIRQLDWSHQIGLVAGDGRVFLIYHRIPFDDNKNPIPWTEGPRVYVDVFQWDASHGVLLTPTDLGAAPTQLPLLQMGYEQVGFYLWAGWDNQFDRLLVMFQSLYSETVYDWVPDPGHRRYPWELVPGLLEKVPVGPFPPMIFDVPDQEFLEDWRYPRGNPGGVTKPPPEMTEGETESEDKLNKRKRKLPNKEVVPLGRPIIDLPLGHLVSYGTTKTQLVVISTSGSSNNLQTGWEPLVVDDGGYDFDVHLEGSRLHCIYRRTPYALDFTGMDLVNDEEHRAVIPNTPGGGYPSFSPLYYRVIEVSPLGIDPDESLDNIPGGDHPQIQWLDPLLITEDRLSEGELVIPSNLVDGFRTVIPELKKTTKLLLRYRKNQEQAWEETPLFTFDPMFIPRRNSGTDVSPFPQFVGEACGTEAHFSSLLRTRQVFLVTSPGTSESSGSSQMDIEAKGLKFTMLMHVVRGDVIHNLGFTGFLGSFLFELTPESEMANPTNMDIVDLCLNQIDHPDGVDPDADPEDQDQEERTWPRGGENRQFEPLHWVSGEDEWDIANTIGGCLVVDRVNKHFFAYTNLGDGGLRVIHQADGLDPRDPPPMSKEVLVENVGGPGVGDDQLVLLTGSGWTDSGLPDYRIDAGSWGSGMQVMLDSLIYAGNDLCESGNLGSHDLSLDQQLNNELQELQDLIAPTSDPRTFRGTGMPRAIFTVDRVSAWTNSRRELDGRASIDSDFPITSYRWSIKGPLTHIIYDSELNELDPEDQHWDGPDYSLTDSQEIADEFDDLELRKPGRYEITLTVGTNNGYSAHSNEVVVTHGPRPGIPRNLRGVYFDIFPNPPHVNLYWQAPEGYDGSSPLTYKVHREITASGDGFEPIGTTTELLYSDDSVASDTRYTYAVCALQGDQEGDYSVATDVIAKSGAIPPINIAATHLVDQVRLTWDSPIMPSDLYRLGYRVYSRNPYDTDYIRISGDEPLVDNVFAGMFGYSNTFVDNRRSLREGHSQHYIVTTIIRDSDNSEIESTWPEPVLAQPVGAAVPNSLTAVETSSGISLNWSAPPGESLTISGYRVFRTVWGSDDYVELTDPALAPISEPSFVDDTAVAGESYVYSVVSVNGGNETGSVTGTVFVEEFWDPLWAIMEGMDTDDTIAVVSAELELCKYRITFHRADREIIPQPLAEGGPFAEFYKTRDITIETLDEWKTAYRFRDHYIDYRFQIHFESKDLTIRGAVPTAAFIDIQEASASIHYERPFTVGVLMKDERYLDPLTPGEEDLNETLLVEDSENRKLPSALSAKPVGPSRMSVPKTEVKVKLTTEGRIAENALSVLGVFAVGELANDLEDKIAALGAMLLTDPAYILLAYTIASIINDDIEPKVEEAAASQLKEELENNMKELLDDSPLMWYAGEGLAEAIAGRVLARDDVEGDPHPGGRSRFREQFWQMVAIDPEKCGVWIRK